MNYEDNDIMSGLSARKKARQKQKHDKKQSISWKFNPKKNEKKMLPNFLDMQVFYRNKKYFFDFLDMEYDPEYNELIVKGDEIELNNQMKLKNKDARQLFSTLNDTDIKDNIVIKELRSYLKSIAKNNDYSITDRIKYLIDTEKVSRKNNDLIQAVTDLFLEAGLKRTYNRYVMPLENNVCRTIDKNEMLQFIYDVCDVKKFSTETLDSVLSYFGREIEPSYHKIVTNNGYFDFNKNKFYKKSEKEIVINKMTPYSYDPDLIGTTPPPILNAFLQRTFRDAPEKKIQQLLEVIGYYLDDGNQYQLLVSFIGPPRSGKSVCIKMICALLNDNHSTVDIMTIDFDSKYAQNLADSDLNVIEEFKGIKNVPEVKNYIGQGGVQLARIYEAPRHYKDNEVPKTLMTTNDFEGLEDVVDTAMIERLRCFIEFRFSITDSRERNPTIHEDIINEPGAMDWLLTNSIHEYMKVRHGKKGTRLSAEKKVDDFLEMLDQYTRPYQHIIEKCFKYDYNLWETYFYDEKFDALVTIGDIQECIYNKQPEAKIKNKSKIKDLVMDTFDLKDGAYNHSSDDEDYYTIEQKQVKIGSKKKIVKFIKGLVRN